MCIRDSLKQSLALPLRRGYRLPRPPQRLFVWGRGSGGAAAPPERERERLLKADSSCLKLQKAALNLLEA
eukprot:573828-Alexandrium_andersonii.AAC.1